MQTSPREDLKQQRRAIEAALQEEYAARRVRVVDHLGRAYATGKRKTSIARVWIWEGPGSISINHRTLDMHFPQITRRAEVLAPFQVPPPSQCNVSCANHASFAKDGGAAHVCMVYLKQ